MICFYTINLCCKEIYVKIQAINKLNALNYNLYCQDKANRLKFF